MTETNDADRMIEINEDYDVVIGKSTFYILGKFGNFFGKLKNSLMFGFC